MHFVYESAHFWNILERVIVRVIVVVVVVYDCLKKIHLNFEIPTIARTITRHLESQRKHHKVMPSVQNSSNQ
jgi:hypothetical protein